MKTATATRLDVESTAPRVRLVGGNIGVPGRYRLDRLIGSGGCGEVYAATDLVRDEQVALKHVCVASDAGRARLRRKVATLRFARFPGIVHLRDDGPASDGCHIVMDRVDGAPFPRRQFAHHWRSLEGLLRRLVEILVPLHDAGLVHRDLVAQSLAVQVLGTRLGPLKLAKGLILTGTPSYLPNKDKIRQMPDLGAFLVWL